MKEVIKEWLEKEVKEAWEEYGNDVWVYYDKDNLSEVQIEGTLNFNRLIAMLNEKEK